MSNENKIWAVLVHLGTNLWFEEGNTRGISPNEPGKVWKEPASGEMRFDRATFDRLLVKFRDSGVNTIILDLADGLKYESHPELAIKGSWSREEMTSALAVMRDMGFEVIPKLNFSATHDVWLKEYSRMLSTSVYRKVCRDLIEEVAEIFKPRFIHIGMDEEGYELQAKYDYAVIRQNDLWWEDLYFLVDSVERTGARAMMWSDYSRHRPDEFVAKCPKSVVQCVWYYLNNFAEDAEEFYRIRVAPLKLFEQHGFDQLPVGSIEFCEDNLPLLTAYCAEVISDGHLLGFCNTSWASTTPEWESFICKMADINEKAMSAYNSAVAKK